MKNLFKQLVVATPLSCGLAHATDNLPPGAIGTVDNPVANTNTHYSFNFTTTQSGSVYLGFSFRQDPAYWEFTNPSLTRQGNPTNLFINNNLNLGGPVTIITSNGSMQTISAPASWGVWYQIGYPPAVEGIWRIGQWYDGAIGSYDGIYQGFSTIAGETYTVNFDVLSTGRAASTDEQARIGVYTGQCTNLTLEASWCTPSASGFTPIAVPAQTVNAGDQSAPPVPLPTTVTTGNTVTTSNVSSGPFIGDGGTLQFVNSTSNLPNNITLTSNGLTVDSNNQHGTLSGNVNGPGGLIISESMSGGSVTLSGPAMFTGVTTVNSGATLINNTDLNSSSGVTNNGTFINHGAAGAIVDNTGNISNTGTLGSVTNYGNIDNSGITGNVINVGNFVNFGTIGDVISNNAVINNSGALGNVTHNNGTINNSTGGTIAGISNNESGGFFNNHGTVIGNVTTLSTFNNYGMVNGTFTNNGLLNNSATLNDVVNNGIFINHGAAGAIVDNTGNISNTGTLGSVTNYGNIDNSGITGNVINVGNFVNFGTIGDVISNNAVINNSGALGNVTHNNGTINNSTGGTIAGISNNESGGFFNNHGTVIGNVTTLSTFNNYGMVNGTFTNNGVLNNSATLNGVVNNGTFTTGSTTLVDYTQSEIGVTNLRGTLIVSGTATLGGTLNISGAPTAIGRYTVLSAGKFVGQFDVITGGETFRYTPAGLQLWIMPSAAVIQAQLDNITSDINVMNSLVTDTITGALGNDCSVFGKMGGCFSVNYGRSQISSGDLSTAGVTVAKKLSGHWRAGVYLGQSLNKPTVNNITYYNHSPAWGGFLGWNKNTDGSGLGITASAITGSGHYIIGTDRTGIGAEAYQLKSTYSIPVKERTTVTPYAGLRFSKFKMNGYTEVGPVFPLTYSDVWQSETDVLAGISLAHDFTAKLSGTVGLSVIHNFNHSVSKINTTSDMGNFTSQLKSKEYTSASIGAELSYEFTKKQRISVSTGWQQRGLYDANITSVSARYTIGF